MGKIISKPIIGVNVITNEIIEYPSRHVATLEGLDTCVIGLSIKNPRKSYKGCIWLYKENSNEIEYRLSIYNNKTRKLLSPLYMTCAVCKETKDWLNFYNHKKLGKAKECIACVKITAANWAKSNRDKINEQARKRKYSQKRSKTDINFRLRRNLSSRLRLALKNNAKTSSILKYLNCTVDELKKHLESKFTEGMTWDNYGEWHIDHILPLSLFDLTNEDNLYKLFDYNNLQPLWAVDNIKKGNKIVGGL